MNISPSIEALLGARDGRITPVAQDVRKRKAFYVSGFDPLGPRRYRELYRREGPEQAEISGYEIRVRGQKRTECGNYRWQVEHLTDGMFTETEFEFLGWDDIVRHSIRPSLGHVYGLMFRTLWIYLSSGAIRAMWRLRSGPLVAGLVPAFLMIFYLVYAALIGFSAGALVTALTGLPVLVGVIAGALAAGAAMVGTRLFEEQMMIYFMVNDLGYSAQEAGQYPKPLSDRLDEFALRIRAAVESGDYDEVLVIGHSSGAQLAVTAISRALQEGPLPMGTPLALMTLGQSIAMTSFLPKANELRADLARVADAPEIFWLDVTAPGDGACFALTDPVANARACGRKPETLNPLVLSAAFRHTMAPGELRQYRWRLLRMHFQYLCSFARPGDFDYFKISGGPLSLASRFAGRECSPSMNAEPVSPVQHLG